MIKILFVNEATDTDGEDECWAEELPGVPQRGDWVSLSHPGEKRALYEVVRAVWYPNDLGEDIAQVYVRPYVPTP